MSYNIDMANIEISEENGENVLLIDSEYADFTIEIHPESRTYWSKMSSKISLYFNTEKYEYRIKTDPIRVHTRLIEQEVEPPPGNFYVKDGVVLESEILAKRGRLVTSTIKDIIKDLKKKVEWHESRVGDPVAMYILFKHPEIISLENYKRYLRKLSEKIKSATQKVKEALRSDKTGLQIINGELWYPEEQLEKLDNKEFKKLKLDEHVAGFEKKFFNKNSKEYVGVSKEEFLSGEETLEYIEVFLNKKSSSKKHEDSFRMKVGTFVIEWIWLFIITSVVLWLLSLVISIIQYSFTFAFFVSGILTFLFAALRSRI